VAKLKVMCARSMHKAVETLTHQFSQRDGHEVALDFGTVGTLQAKIANGETADVIILAQPAIVTMIAAGALAAGTQMPVARTSIGVAVRAGAPLPDISTPEAFKRTVLGARAIALSDPGVGGSAGVYLVGLFERMGLTEAVKQKGMLQQSGVEVAKRVLEGKADFGLTLSGEIASVEGVVIAGSLPPPIGNDTTYVGAISAGSKERAAAQAFLAALTAQTSRGVWKTAGFDRPE
jgi:molybdate transport system substrate-binding protein